SKDSEETKEIEERDESKETESSTEETATKESTKETDESTETDTSKEEETSEDASAYVLTRYNILGENAARRHITNETIYVVNKEGELLATVDNERLIRLIRDALADNAFPKIVGAADGVLYLEVDLDKEEGHVSCLVGVDLNTFQLSIVWQGQNQIFLGCDIRDGKIYLSTVNLGDDSEFEEGHEEFVFKKTDHFTYETEITYTYDYLGEKDYLQFNRPTAEDLPGPSQVRNNEESLMTSIEDNGYILTNGSKAKMIRKDQEPIDLPKGFEDLLILDYDKDYIVYMSHYNDQLGYYDIEKDQFSLVHKEERFELNYTYGGYKDGKIYFMLYNSNEYELGKEVILYQYDISTKSLLELYRAYDDPDIDTWADIPGFRIIGDYVFFMVFDGKEYRWVKMDVNDLSREVIPTEYVAGLSDTSVYGTSEVLEYSSLCDECAGIRSRCYIETFKLDPKYSEHADEINKRIKEECEQFDPMPEKDGTDETDETCVDGKHETEDKLSRIDRVKLYYDQYLVVYIDQLHYTQEKRKQLVFDLKSGDEIGDMEYFLGDAVDFIKAIENAAQIQHDRGQLEQGTSEETQSEETQTEEAQTEETQTDKTQSDKTQTEETQINKNYGNAYVLEHRHDNERLEKEQIYILNEEGEQIKSIDRERLLGLLKKAGYEFEKPKIIGATYEYLFLYDQAEEKRIDVCAVDLKTEKVIRVDTPEKGKIHAADTYGHKLYLKLEYKDEDGINDIREFFYDRQEGESELTPFLCKMGQIDPTLMEDSAVGTEIFSFWHGDYHKNDWYIDYYNDELTAVSSFEKYGITITPEKAICLDKELLGDGNFVSLKDLLGAQYYKVVGYDEKYIVFEKYQYDYTDKTTELWYHDIDAQKNYKIDDKEWHEDPDLEILTYQDGKLYLVENPYKYEKVVTAYAGIYQYDLTENELKRLYYWETAPGAAIEPGWEGFQIIGDSIYFEGVQGENVSWVKVDLKGTEIKPVFTDYQVGQIKLYKYGKIRVEDESVICDECKERFGNLYLEVFQLNEGLSVNYQKINESLRDKKSISDEARDADHNLCKDNEGPGHDKDFYIYQRYIEDVEIINNQYLYVKVCDFKNEWNYPMPSKSFHYYAYDLKTGDEIELDYRLGEHDEEIIKKLQSMK
ncbi:MAG: hypothetical protein J6Z03_05050, partial [Erysipelotrichaceae bacterium]|nr:hypothetical protein [Erysipelotrichaceae bacterium]